VLGVSGAGLIFGAATGLMAMNKYSALSEICPAMYCPPSARGDVDSYHTLGALSTAGFIVGGAAVIASVVLFLAQAKVDRTPTHLARSDPPGKPATICEGSMFLPGALGILGHF
jgi:hypothetical protein